MDQRVLRLDSSMIFLTTLRRLLVALIVFGLISGSAALASPMSMDGAAIVKAQIQTANMPCGMMMQGNDTASHGKLPCNAITPDCVKRMVCVQMSALPERFVDSQASTAFATVAYRSRLLLLDGRTVEPDLSPPVAS